MPGFQGPVTIPLHFVSSTRQFLEASVEAFKCSSQRGIKQAPMIGSKITSAVSLASLPNWPTLRFARRSVLALCIKLAGACAVFLLQVSLVRMMGQSGYGEYAYVVAWMQLLLLFSQSGLSMAAVRYVAEYFANHELALVRGFIHRCTQAALFSSVLLGIVMCGTAAALLPAGSASIRYFGLAGCALPALALHAVNCAVFRGLERAILGMLGLLLYPTLFLVELLGANCILSRPITAGDALALNLGAAIGCVVITIAVRRSLLPKLNGVNPLVFHTGRWISTALEMMLVSGLIFVQGRAGVIFSGWFLSASATGTYAVIDRMADAAMLGVVSVEMLIAPKFASLHFQGNRRELQRSARSAAWESTLITLMIMLILALSGKLIMRVFGPEFVAGYTPLMIMLLGVATKAICGSAGLLLCMTGHQRDTIVIALGSLLLNVVLSLFLIPRYELIGTAIAFTCSMAAWNIAMLMAVRWRLGIWGCIGDFGFSSSS